MKRGMMMNKTIKSIGLAALSAALLWAAPQEGYAQRGKAADRLLERALNNLEDLPAGLQEDVTELQEALTALRDVWLEEYRPGEDATAEEIEAAREAFQADYAEEIAANRELRVSIARELRVGIKDRIDDTDWSEDARALYQEYQDLQDQLAAAWTEIRDGLGEDATREQIAEAKEQFQEDNAELIARQKELAKQVRELIRDNRRGPPMERPGMPAHLQELRNEMAALRQQVRERRQDARDEMKGMTREEREDYRRALLDELKGIHDDIKERRRQVIDDLRDGQDGDRRPGG